MNKVQSHMNEQKVVLINKGQKTKSTKPRILNESKTSYYENNLQNMRDKN